MTLLMAALLGALSLLGPTSAPASDAGCRQMRITGYVRTAFSHYTWDGTSIYSDEPIVAASWDIPMGYYVQIDGLGTYRVADRGLLGSSGWVDVAVWSPDDAYALTGYRQVCVLAPDELG
jgi:3D (Asp-Asp-Asp) domain-containing protein